MITRNLISEKYYVEGDKSATQMMENSYTQAITANQAFWSEADTDTRFKIGDQSLYQNYQGNVPLIQRKNFYFNRVRRVCNMITGYQRQHRKSIITVPVEHNDDQSSSQWTKLLFNTLAGANANEMISTAFESGSVTTGLTLLNTWIDKSRDPVSGDIRIDACAFNSFIMDPYWRKKDLSDCNFIWRRQWLSKAAAKALLPKEMQSIVEEMRPKGNRDGRFQFMAESYNYAMENLMAYDEYWYRCTREAQFIIDHKNGLSIEWEHGQESLDQFLALHPNISVVKQDVPTVKLVMSIEGEVVYHGPNPLKVDRYPFVPFIGYYEPDVPYFQNRMQGVVRGLRDAQYLYNRRKTIELDILESQVTSGYIYKPTSLVNPESIHLAGQGRGIAIKNEADISDIQPIIAPQIPPSMVQLSELLAREIQEISGVNEELLGSADDDKAGILSMLRQGAGLTTLQGLFDNLDQSQKLMGELFVELIRKNFSIGKIGRILGEEPVEEFKDKVWLNYDIRVEDGVNTTTQRQMAFSQAIHLRETGIPIPPKYILELATLQDKEKLMATIEQEEQAAQQQQQQQMQMQMALQEAQIKNLDGQATANTGLGVERLARLEENKELAVERRAKAIEDLSDAQLNRAKTLKELQDIDITQIQKLLQIADALKLGDEDVKDISDSNSALTDQMIT